MIKVIVREIQFIVIIGLGIEVEGPIFLLEANKRPSKYPKIVIIMGNMNVPLIKETIK